MGRDREGRRIGFSRCAARIAHDGGKLCEERLEAVDRRAVCVVSTRDLRFRACRAFGRRYRVAGGLGRLILVGKEQLALGRLQVPLDVVGEHAEEDMGADRPCGRQCPVAQAMVGGPDLEIDGLQGPKRPLDLRERFVVTHTARTIQTLGLNRGADDIDAIEGGFRGDGVLLAGEGEGRVGEGEGKVLGHLVAVDHTTDRHADLILPLQASGPHAGLDRAQRLFGGL